MKVFRKDDPLMLAILIVFAIFSVFKLGCPPNLVFISYLMLIVGVILGRSGM